MRYLVAHIAAVRQLGWYRLSDTRDTSTDAMRMDAENIVSLRVDAPGVDPDTVSTVDALSLAVMYFGALQKLADDREVELTLKGIYVSHGSLNIAAHTAQPEVAKESVLALSGGLSDEGRMPKIVRDVVVELRRFKEAKVQALVGNDFERDLSPSKYAPRFVWSHVRLRATPQRVGGASPRARFTSPSEHFAFTLEADAEKARNVGANLYRELEIEARVKRDEEGVIVGGELESFEPLTSGNALAEWRDWYRANCAHLDEADDVLSELGRRDDEGQGASEP